MKLNELQQQVQTDKGGFQLCFQHIVELKADTSTVYKLTPSPFHQTGRRHVLQCPKPICRFD